MASRIFHMLIDAIIPPICPLCNRGHGALRHMFCPAILWPRPVACIAPCPLTMIRAAGFVVPV